MLNNTGNAVNEALNILSVLQNKRNAALDIPAQTSPWYFTAVRQHLPTLPPSINKFLSTLFISGVSQELPMQHEIAEGKRINETVALLQIAAKDDNPDALYLLGQIYLVGLI